MLDEDDFSEPASLPGEPTEALPGSERKIRIMTERAARREQLFHPLDGLVRASHFPRLPPMETPHWVVQPLDLPDHLLEAEPAPEAAIFEIQIDLDVEDELDEPVSFLPESAEQVC